MKKNFLLYSVISGITLGIGFIFQYLWPLSFFGIALLVFVILKAHTLKSSVLYAYFSGLISWSFSLGAIFFSALPLYWYGIYNVELQILLVVGSLLLTVGVAALGFVVAALAIRFFYTNTWRDILIVPSVWVLSEYLGALGFYAISFGPGSYFGPHFSIGWLGYLLADDRVLLQGAYFGGIYALSFMVVLIGMLVFKFIQSSDTKARTKYSYILVAFIILWLGAQVIMGSKETNSIVGVDENSKTISVAVVSRQQPPMLTITKKEEKKYFDEMYNAIKPLNNVEMLVFPESAYFLDTLLDDSRIDVRKTLINIGVSKKAPIVVDSETATNINGSLLSKVSYYKKGGQLQFGYKQLLVPIGEYLPNIYFTALHLLGLNDLLNKAQSVRAFEPGIVSGRGIVKGSLIATRFCFEVVSPALYREDVLNGAEMFINVSSLSWFQGSVVVYKQMQRIAKVRAVENGRWYIQSGNMAPAFVLNQYGDVIAETDFGKAGAIQVSVPTRTNRAPYVTFGTGILLLPLFFLILFNTRMCLLIRERCYKQWISVKK